MIFKKDKSDKTPPGGLNVFKSVNWLFFFIRKIILVLFLSFLAVAFGGLSMILDLFAKNRHYGLSSIKYFLDSIFKGWIFHKDFWTLYSSYNKISIFEYASHICVLVAFIFLLLAILAIIYSVIRIIIVLIK